MTDLLPDLIRTAAARAPDRVALVQPGQTLTYGELAERMRAFASAVIGLGLGPGERVAVFLEKRFETVVAMFGTAAAGGAFVPINPLFKARQVGHILRDCNVRLLVTAPSRLEGLRETIAECPDLRAVLLVDYRLDEQQAVPAIDGVTVAGWTGALADGEVVDRPAHRRIDVDMTAIFYTSGSTGLPKGVVLSHRNMVAGARSVAEYLENNPDDRLLAALPLSFDAGFSQLSTAFSAGARCVLLNYLLPRDVVNAVAREGITGLTAVPPLYIQISQVDWPAEPADTLRYFANTGGVLPRATLERLRAALPRSKVFLMYGLTEAFRSTYLPPEEVDRRPDSIGKAIPNAEILVVDQDDRPVPPGGAGELVHRGALVSLGYWNDPARTAERFKPLPTQPRQLCVPEMCVRSGDMVQIDQDGFLYFIGRRDEMIKTSGYRVSPNEIEEVLYASGLVAEAVAVGAPHRQLGQGVVVVAAPAEGCTLDRDAIMLECRQQLPIYMGPHLIIEKRALPRNPNGKIDRASLRQEVAEAFAEVEA
jgi:acyl-CoA ligase (AMP-forming) (exosortase A-associated)